MAAVAPASVPDDTTPLVSAPDAGEPVQEEPAVRAASDSGKAEAAAAKEFDEATAKQQKALQMMFGEGEVKAQEGAAEEAAEAAELGEATPQPAATASARVHPQPSASPTPAQRERARARARSKPKSSSSGGSTCSGKKCLGATGVLVGALGLLIGVVFGIIALVELLIESLEEFSEALDEGDVGAYVLLVFLCIGGLACCCICCVALVKYAGSKG